MVDGSLKGKWAVTVAREIGIPIVTRNFMVKTDSEAARSFTNRRGLGRMRHIEVRQLWLQEEVRHDRIKVSRVRGADNPADLLTNFLTRREVEERLLSLKFVWK